jgi:hypothetical protein
VRLLGGAQRWNAINPHADAATASDASIAFAYGTFRFPRPEILLCHHGAEIRAIGGIAMT